MNQWAIAAASIGATGYNTYSNGRFLHYYCVKHERYTPLRECPVCRGIPNGFAGIPHTQSR